MTDECVFCRIVAGTEPHHRVANLDRGIAIEPLNPVVPGHLLVIPTEHVVDFTDDPAVTGRVAREAATLAEALGGQWNLITSAGPVATQTVFHLHIHLVPRRPGDGLTLPWTRACECGHNRTAHLDRRGDWTTCEFCDCLAYAGPRETPTGHKPGRGDLVSRHLDALDPRRARLVCRNCKAGACFLCLDSKVCPCGQAGHR